MTIMTRKGYVRRTKLGTGYIYRARVTEQKTKRRMLRDTVDRVFEGSAAAAMLNLLETNDFDASELSQIRKLIHQKDKEQSS